MNYNFRGTGIFETASRVRDLVVFPLNLVWFPDFRPGWGFFLSPCSSPWGRSCGAGRVDVREAGRNMMM
jgi:hypothetical protein